MTTTSHEQSDAIRTTADQVAGEVWSWLNRHDAPWSPSDDKVTDLAFAITEALTQSGGTTDGDDTVAREAALTAAGFRKRYRLCGHPAYPDPLDIHPPTIENVTRIYDEYVAPTFEDYVGRLGYAPFQYSGGPRYTAETFNPRILITWEYVGERQVFVPEPTGE
jgi:hypothetical protein